MPARACILYGPKCSNGGRCAPGYSRCEFHGGGAWRRQKPEARRRYDDEAWRQLRTDVLRASPYCARCGALASEVDHIVSVADGGAMYDRANLQSLCQDCHKAKTAEDNRRRRGGNQ